MVKHSSQIGCFPSQTRNEQQFYFGITIFCYVVICSTFSSIWMLLYLLKNYHLAVVAVLLFAALRVDGDKV